MSEEETKDQEKDQEKETGFEPDDDYNGTPVFDVDQKSFFNNMRVDRNRLRFPNGSKPSEFMKNTKHRQSFYVRYTDKQGQKFMKKFK